LEQVRQGLKFGITEFALEGAELRIIMDDTNAFEGRHFLYAKAASRD
jgi:hypothetical protein